MMVYTPLTYGTDVGILGAILILKNGAASRKDLMVYRSVLLACAPISGSPRNWERATLCAYDHG